MALAGLEPLAAADTDDMFEAIEDLWRNRIDAADGMANNESVSFAEAFMPLPPLFPPEVEALAGRFPPPEMPPLPATPSWTAWAAPAAVEP